MKELTHFDSAGHAHMVNVAAKSESLRRAVAEGLIALRPETLNLILGGSVEKGDVLGVARIAGIMAAKKTADLIPLCHPLALTHVSIELEPLPEQSAIRCQATVETLGRTGAEMEALVAVQIALLTIYDMCKTVDRGMTLHGIKLIEKRGGRSGPWKREG
jgi:cyclic pyranopterin phosphate synthase